jgi:hypothetical protein
MCWEIKFDGWIFLGKKGLSLLTVLSIIDEIEDSDWAEQVAFYSRAHAVDAETAAAAVLPKGMTFQQVGTR